MPMHSIKQVIREEEEAEGLDDKTTNKDASIKNDNSKNSKKAKCESNSVTTKKEGGSSSNKDDTGGDYTQQSEKSGLKNAHSSMTIKQTSKAKLSHKSSSLIEQDRGTSVRNSESGVLCDTPKNPDSSKVQEVYSSDI